MEGSPLTLVALFVFGLLAWSFVEYGIHGLLSHRFRTPISPLHWGHHREPRAVFTSPLAWAPSAGAIFALAALGLGVAPGAALVLGLLAGFARYERVHWRIHFRLPRNARERRLRDHHLAHHFVDARRCHGVTTRFWDHVFGTLSEEPELTLARVRDWPPLDGPSSWRAHFRVRGRWAWLRVKLTRGGESGPNQA